MFTSEHFIWIGLCIGFIGVMLYVSKKQKWSLKKAGMIMSVICAVSEISKIMSDMIENTGGGMNLDPRSLPFHLCSMMIFAVLFITFGKDGKTKRLIIDFVAVMGTLGSFCAIMIPTNGTDFAKIFAYQCFVYHAGLLWFALYLIVSQEAVMNIKAMLRNIGILAGLAFLMIYVNGALSVYGTNFMYVVRPPMENLPLLNLDHGWYVYFIHLTGLGILLISIFYLPFILVHKIENTERAK